MEKMTVSVSESQAERIRERIESNKADSRSEALRQELERSNAKSPARETIDIAASSIGLVGLLLVGFTFFMSDSLRMIALVPVIGSSVLFSIGYLIDAPGLPGVVRHE